MAEVSFKKFAGLRNDVDAERFAEGDLAAAVNVDLDDTGRLSMRDGFAVKLTAAGAHSVWSDGRVCLFVQNGSLLRLHENYSTTVLRTGMGSKPVSYVAVNGRVYFSNGDVTGIVENNGTARTWGIVPPGLPIAAQAGGSLFAGRYQYVLTYVREDGQESGAGLAGAIDVTVGGIAFSAIPVSSDPGVTHKILYITPQDGDVLYRAAVLENATTSYTWTGGPLSLPLDTQYLQAAPAGEIVAYHYGTLYVVQGSNVFHSSPFGYELFDPRDYLPFDSPVCIFAPVDDGIWVGTQKAIVWLNGVEPGKLQQVPRADIGSTRGTLSYLDSKMLSVDVKQPDTDIAVWWTDDGVCAGYPGGVLAKLTRLRYKPAFKGVTGAGMIRNTRNGIQYLAIVNHN